MAEKPIYEELEQRVNELENEAVERSQLEKQMKFLSLAIEQSSEGIGVTDLDGNLKYLNASFAKIYGYSPEELVGKNISVFHTPQQMPSVEAAKREIKERGNFKGEIWHVRRDGSIFPTIMNNSLVLDDEGMPVGTIAMLLDISDMKQAEEALRESEEKYRNLYKLIRLMADNVPDLIWAKDLEGKFLFVNQAMCDKLIMCGSPDKALGKNDMFFAEQERNAGHEHTFGETCIDSDAVTKERKAPGRFLEDGFVRNRHLVLDVHKAPFLNEDGEMIGTVGCGRDVTKEKETERALRESEERYRTLFEKTINPILVIDNEGNYIECNDAALQFLECTRDELLIKNVADFIPPGTEREVLDERKPLWERGESTEIEYCVQGKVKILELAITPGMWRGKREVYGIGKDITDRKRAEEALRKARDELEQKVEKRTAELRAINEELEIRTKNLEETNTALEVLLKRREEDKTELEEKVLLNVKELVMPYLRKLKYSGLNEIQKSYANILELNVNDVVSPFSYRLSSKYLSLTPTEISVANLVKQGKTTKEIAELLNSSSRAIEFHRGNLRKKLGVKNRKANLRTRLLYFSKP